MVGFREDNLDVSGNNNPPIIYPPHMRLLTYGGRKK